MNQQLLDRQAQGQNIVTELSQMLARLNETQESVQSHLNNSVHSESVRVIANATDGIEREIKAILKRFEEVVVPASQMKEVQQLVDRFKSIIQSQLEVCAVILALVMVNNESADNQFSHQQARFNSTYSSHATTRIKKITSNDSEYRVKESDSEMNSIAEQFVQESYADSISQSTPSDVMTYMEVIRSFRSYLLSIVNNQPIIKQKSLSDEEFNNKNFVPKRNSEIEIDRQQNRLSQRKEKKKCQPAAIIFILVVCIVVITLAIIITLRK